MIFEGIETWPENEPLVEIRRGDRLIDLHNWASFIGFEYRLPERLILRFDYDETEGGMRVGASSREIRLRFEGVSDLRVDREKVDPVYEADTLSEFIYRELRPGRGWVQATMMDGLRIRFEAGSIGLEEGDA